jgi:aryl-phospho-beta-D-glucosidase BglC (GH1 family)
VVNGSAAVPGIRLRGLNVGDPYHQYRKYGGDDFSAARASYMADTYNCNTVRIAVLNSLYRDYKDPCLAYLKQCVQTALDAGMFPIVDWHCIGWPDGGVEDSSYDSSFSYDSSTDLAKDFWDTVSREITDRRVVYELWNEPTGSAGTWGTLKPFWEDLIGIIRGNGRKNLILASSCQYTADLRGVADDPLDDGNTAYAWHIYIHFSGLDSVSEWDTMLGSLSGSKPVILSEWGWENTSAVPSNADTWLEYFDETKGLHSTAWAYCREYTPKINSDWSSNPASINLNAYGNFTVSFLQDRDTVKFPVLRSGNDE